MTRIVFPALSIGPASYLAVLEVYSDGYHLTVAVPGSIADQIELCQRYAITQGCTVTEAVIDAAQSGASQKPDASPEVPAERSADLRVGGGYTFVVQDRYGCATLEGKGPCENSRTFKRQNIEHRVLGVLRESMLTSDAVDAFMYVLVLARRLVLPGSVCNAAKKASRSARDAFFVFCLVAGIGFEPMTFRL